MESSLERAQVHAGGRTDRGPAPPARRRGGGDGPGYGPGHRARASPHIFDRFRQGDSSVTRPQGGLGLGWLIARQLVQLHRGTIRAESLGEGRGTTFTVLFPLTADSRPWSRGTTALELAEPAGQVLRDLAVLVVDDDADAREALAVSLVRSGARVSSAASVAEAMVEAARRWPALLVSDIGMPGEDGISLIGRVRRLERRAADGSMRWP